MTLSAGTSQILRVPILRDDLKELDETFSIVLTGRGSPGGTSATIEFQATIAADDEAVTLKLRQPDGTFADDLRVDEGAGRARRAPSRSTSRWRWIWTERLPAGM